MATAEPEPVALLYILATFVQPPTRKSLTRRALYLWHDRCFVPDTGRQDAGPTCQKKNSSGVSQRAPPHAPPPRGLAACSGFANRGNARPSADDWRACAGGR